MNAAYLAAHPAAGNAPVPLFAPGGYNANSKQHYRPEYVQQGYLDDTQIASNRFFNTAWSFITGKPLFPTYKDVEINEREITDTPLGRLYRGRGGLWNPVLPGLPKAHRSVGKVVGYSSDPVTGEISRLIEKPKVNPGNIRLANVTMPAINIDDSFGSTSVQGSKKRKRRH